MRRIALDTETTGLSPLSGHRIVEIGCVELDDNIPTGKEWHSYINPEREVPEAAEAIHGLSTKFLSGKPLFRDVSDDLLLFLAGAELVIHNAKFDIGFLNNELNLLKKPTINLEKTIDTVMLAKKIIPGAAASLDALCKRFNIDLSRREKHGALLDAQLLAEVYLELTGGRQSSLELNSFEEKKKKINQKEILLKKNDLIVKLFNSEIKEHKKMINKLKKPIWLK
tara:strand:- start:26134 stop:26808 length:675 start_codon:yes stop_codon:yes gene_type:complete